MNKNQKIVLHKYEKNDKRKVTIFRKGEFFGSVVKNEIYLLELSLANYAQYNEVPYIVFMKPRGRKALATYITGYNTVFVIIDGWHENLKPPSMWTEYKDQGIVQVRQSKYSSFDERHVLDFNKWYEENIPNKHTVLFDERYTTQQSAEVV